MRVTRFECGKITILDVNMLCSEINKVCLIVLYINIYLFIVLPMYSFFFFSSIWSP